MKPELRRKRTKCLTYSALLSALGTVILYLGSFLGDLDLTMAALASILVFYPVMEMHGGYPFMVWIVTSFLSLLLLPNKTPAVFYLLIGYYPIAKIAIEKLSSRFLRILFKVLCFHASLAGSVGFLLLFFQYDLFSSLGWKLAIGYVLALVAFFLFDFTMSKLVFLYRIRFHEKFKMK